MNQKQFLYDTHAHTKLGSRCASISPEETVDNYLSLGYDGIFLTEHYINCPSSPYFGMDFDTYKLRYADYYKTVRRVGQEKGLKVFFGVEYTFVTSDFLILGLPPEWFENLPKSVFDGYIKDFFRIIKNEGGFISHAHPFRDDAYIGHIRLFPDCVDGIEVYNACRSDRCNRLAQNFADEYGFINTAGSDSHHLNQVKFAAMQTQEEVKDEEHFVRLLRDGKTTIKKIEKQI